MKIVFLLAALSLLIIGCGSSSSDQLQKDISLVDTTEITKRNLKIALVFKEQQVFLDQTTKELVVSIFRAYLDPHIIVVSEQQEADVILYLKVRAEKAREPIEKIPYWYASVHCRAVSNDKGIIYWDFKLRSGERSREKIIPPVSARKIGDAEAKRRSLEKVVVAAAKEINFQTRLPNQEYLVQFIDFKSEESRKSMLSVIETLVAKDKITVLDEQYGGKRYFELKIKWSGVGESQEQVASVLIEKGENKGLDIESLPTKENNIILQLRADNLPVASSPEATETPLQEATPEDIPTPPLPEEKAQSPSQSTPEAPATPSELESPQAQGEQPQQQPQKTQQTPSQEQEKVQQEPPPSSEEKVQQEPPPSSEEKESSST